MSTSKDCHQSRHCRRGLSRAQF